MPANLQRNTDIKLEELAKQYEISGASILNAVQYAALQTYARNNGIICQKDLLDGIRKEYLKEDKSFWILNNECRILNVEVKGRLLNVECYIYEI